MKIFWTVVLVLAVAAAFFVWQRSRDAAPSVMQYGDDAPEAPRSPGPVESIDHRGSAHVNATPKQRSDDNAAAASAAPVTDPNSHSIASETHSAVDAASTNAQQSSDDDLARAEDPAAALVEDLLGTSGDSSSESLAEEDASSAEENAAPISPLPDGGVLLDGKYRVLGSGTAEDPYQITWDLLLSANQEYQPRQGKTKMPQRIALLNGKHIQIPGYLAFPLAQSESKEVLVMLNMWDGCCIGVPPSPYDAIEVKLSEPIALGGKRFLNYGTLRGVLKVDPYIVNDWLLGLYLVEGGSIDFAM